MASLHLQPEEQSSSFSQEFPPFIISDRSYDTICSLVCGYSQVIGSSSDFPAFIERLLPMLTWTSLSIQTRFRDKLGGKGIHIPSLKFLYYLSSLRSRKGRCS